MEVTHSLALKVMRLTRPTLVSESPFLLYDETDLLGRPALEDLSNTPEQIPDFRQIRLSGMLSLPQNFGNIYLGETFTAYVSVHNDSNYLCRDIIVKADLQTNSSKVSMTSGHVEPVIELPPDRSIDQVLTHEVKELGPHILVCTVSYTANTGDKQFFKKYFKFHVQRPLDVKTDFRVTENDELYLEARIQNITAGPIFLDKVYLDPSPSVQLIDEGSHKDMSSIDNLYNSLQELEVCQFLYRLKPLDVSTTTAAPTDSINSTNTPSGNSQRPIVVGKLDITWRSHMGQRARLQTSLLTTQLASPDDIRLTVEEVPADVKLDSVFHLHCRITNQSSRVLELKLSTVSGSGGALQLCGSVCRHLSPIAPGASESLDIQVLALQPGLHSVSGLVLTDSLLSRPYQFNDLVQVLVQP